MRNDDRSGKRIAWRRWTLVGCAAVAVWAGSLMLTSDWWVIGNDPGKLVVGVQRGGVYLYWAADPPGMTLVELAARLRAYRDFPMTIWSARSATAYVVPTWAVLVVILIAPVLAGMVSRRLGARKRMELKI